MTAGCSCGFKILAPPVHQLQTALANRSTIAAPFLIALNFLRIHKGQPKTWQRHLLRLLESIACLNRKKIFILFKMHKIVPQQATESPLDKGLLHKPTCLSSASSSFCSLSLSRISCFNLQSFSCCLSFSSHNMIKFFSAFFSSSARFFPAYYIQKIFTTKVMLHLCN